jgi:hypothetical protein
MATAEDGEQGRRRYILHCPSAKSDYIRGCGVCSSWRRHGSNRILFRPIARRSAGCHSCHGSLPGANGCSIRERRAYCAAFDRALFYAALAGNTRCDAWRQTAPNGDMDCVPGRGGCFRPGLGPCRRLLDCLGLHTSVMAVARDLRNAHVIRRILGTSRIVLPAAILVGYWVLGQAVELRAKEPQPLRSKADGHLAITMPRGLLARYARLPPVVDCVFCRFAGSVSSTAWIVGPPQNMLRRWT